MSLANLLVIFQEKANAFFLHWLYKRILTDKRDQDALATSDSTLTKIPSIENVLLSNTCSVEFSLLKSKRDNTITLATITG